MFARVRRAAVLGNGLPGAGALLGIEERAAFDVNGGIDLGDDLRHAWTLHVLNHVLSARTRVLRHNAHLKAAAEKKSTDEPPEYRDQGFARPRVLVVLPYRSSAHKFVKKLAELMGDDGSGKAIRNFPR